MPEYQTMFILSYLIRIYKQSKYATLVVLLEILVIICYIRFKKERERGREEACVARDKSAWEAKAGNKLAMYMASFARDEESSGSRLIPRLPRALC
jgi:hypothetical protein